MKSKKTWIYIAVVVVVLVIYFFFNSNKASDVVDATGDAVGAVTDTAGSVVSSITDKIASIDGLLNNQVELDGLVSSTLSSVQGLDINAARGKIVDSLVEKNIIPMDMAETFKSFDVSNLDAAKAKYDEIAGSLTGDNKQVFEKAYQVFIKIYSSLFS